MEKDPLFPKSVLDFSSQTITLFETSEEAIQRLQLQNRQISDELIAERKFRYDAEQKVKDLQKKLDNFEKKKCKNKTEPIHSVRGEFSEFKSDGKRKARPADPIRSYEDYIAIQNYFLNRKQKESLLWLNERDQMLWTIGVALGLRISDLFQLKICHILNDDLSFRKRILIIEQKTKKLNDCLLTEIVIKAVSRYFDAIHWNFSLGDYLFTSHKTKGKINEEYGWKLLSDAGKALGLPFVVGSHTMRKSFANIAACVDNSTIDMNAITKIQGLLNHADQRVTMRYLGTFRNMFDRARISVSEFLLGRTTHELTAGNNYSIDDLVTKLDSLEAKLFGA